MNHHTLPLPIESIESIGGYRVYRFYRATVTVVSTMLWCSISHYGVLQLTMSSIAYYGAMA